MKLPRGIPGDTLIRALERIGYRIVRQKGSRVRLPHKGPPAHLVTVPRHNPLKTGTLHAVLLEVARMRAVTLDTLMDLL